MVYLGSGTSECSATLSKPYEYDLGVIPGETRGTAAGANIQPKSQ